MSCRHGADRVSRAQLPDDAIGTVLLERVENPLGDLAIRLLPGDALPLPGPALSHALERVANARGVVHALAEAGAFLATARVGIGEPGPGLWVLGRLLLAPDESVLHVDVPAAVGLVPAVHEVGALDDLVPAPALAVDVPPVAVAGCRRMCFVHRVLGRRRWRTRTQISDREHEPRGAGRSADQEGPPADARLPLRLTVHSSPSPAERTRLAHRYGCVREQHGPVEAQPWVPNRAQPSTLTTGSPRSWARP